jgi:hypothetical protein
MTGKESRSQDYMYILLTTSKSHIVYTVHNYRRFGKYKTSYMKFIFWN